MKLSLLPDNDNPDSVRKYRAGQAVVSYSAWLIAVFIFTAAFVGWPKIGALAWANDVENKVKTEVEAVVAPIRKDVADIKTAVDALTAANRRSEAAALGNTIINATRERCKAIAQGRDGDAWADRILELRRQYRDLSGEYFVALTCADV